MGVRGCRPGDRGLRPPARAAAAAARAVGELAVPRRARHRPALGPDPDLHPHVPALRGPRAVRHVGAPTRSSSSAHRHRTIVEATQLWWSVRPHHPFGTVELRICDAQTRGEESFALAGLIAACIVQAALDHDDGRLPKPLRQREIEENLWRAIRYGMDGEMIDWRGSGGADRPTPRSSGCSSGPRRPAMRRGDRRFLRARTARSGPRAARGRASLADIYREAVAETRRTYAPRAGPRGLDPRSAMEGTRDSPAASSSPTRRSCGRGSRSSCAGPGPGPAGRERGVDREPDRAADREARRAGPRAGAGGIEAVRALVDLIDGEVQAPDPRGALRAPDALRAREGRAARGRGGRAAPRAPGRQSRRRSSGPLVGTKPDTEVDCAPPFRPSA